MSKRRRPTCSFKPVTDELEKLVGVSSFAVGDLAGAALAIGNGSNAINHFPLTDESIGGTGHHNQEIATCRISTSIRLPELPNQIVATSRTMDVAAFHASGNALAERPVLHTIAAGTIRPLTLAPSAQPITQSVMQPPSQPMSLGNAVGAGGGVSPSTGVGGGTSGNQGSGLAAAGANSGTAQVQGAVSASSDGVSTVSGLSSSLARTAPSTESHAVATHLTVANSTATDLRQYSNSLRANRPRGPEGPTSIGPLSDGYVATGGSFGPSAAMFSDASGESGGSGGTGAGSGTGTTSGVKTVPASGTSQTGGGIVSGTGGTYTVSHTSPSGGGYAKGKIQITQPDGTDIIGGVAQLSLRGYGAGILSNIEWQTTGAPEMYSNQIVPNPPALSDPNGTGAPSTPNGPTTFQNQKYTLPSGSGAAAATLNFDWGETPGKKTLSFSGDIKVGSSPEVPVKASVSVDVGAPKISGEIKYLTSASIQDGYLDYSNPPGTFSPGKPGIDWSQIQPGQGQGSFEVEQLLTGSSIVYTSTTKPTTYKFGNRDINPTTGAVTPASYPLVDVRKNTTTPFYADAGNGVLSGPDNDSPRALLLAGYSVNFTDGFEDYIMFKPASGGIWVPEANFSWAIIATATPGKVYGWSVHTTVAHCSSITVSHSTWPIAWKDLGYKYVQIANQ